MKNPIDTYHRLIHAALELFAVRSIKKTGVEEIALQAGLSRNTAYRYFRDKKALVRAALLEVVAVFQRAQESLARGEFADVEAVLDAIGTGLARLPGGNLPAQLDELRRVYPGVFNEVQAARVAVTTKLLSQLFEMAEARGTMRAGLNPVIVQAIFTETIINLAANPRLADLQLDPEEVYMHAKSIFLHGILKE